MPPAHIPTSVRDLAGPVSFYEMPARTPAGGERGKAGPSELLDYVLAYAKQETLDPVVRQAKALGKGIAGAVLLSIGTVLLAVGFLRALQAQFGSTSAATTSTVSGALRARAVAPLLRASASSNPYGSGHPLSGNWSWVPYMGGVLFCLLVAVFCVTRILRGARR